MNYYPETLSLHLCLVTIVYKTRWLYILLLPSSSAVLYRLFIQVDETGQWYVLDQDFVGNFTLKVAALTITLPVLMWALFSSYLLAFEGHPHLNQQETFIRLFQWPRGLEPVLLHDKLLYLSKLIDLGTETTSPLNTSGLINTLVSCLSSVQAELKKSAEKADTLVLKLNEAPHAGLHFLQENLIVARNSQRELAHKLQTVVELNSTASRELDQLNQTLTSLPSQLRREELTRNKALENTRGIQRGIDRLTRETNACSFETHRLLGESRRKYEEALQRRSEVQSEIDELQRQNCIVAEELGATKSNLQASQAQSHDLERQLAAASREKAEKRNDVRKQCEIIGIMEEEVEEVRQGIQAAVEKYKTICSRETQLLREGMGLVRPNVETQTAQTGDTCKLGECSLCMAMDIDCVLVSCGHICCCSDCANSLCRYGTTPVCPICREEIESVLKCYIT